MVGDINQSTMQYWLVKSEPSAFSWEMLVKAGKTTWDGVRSYAARNNLKAMKKGDEVLFYHSNEGLCVVGIASVAKEFFQDPTTTDPNWVAVDIKPVKALKRPVTLTEMKAEKKLANMALLRIGRLSVSPVSPEEWKVILEMSGR